MTYDVEINGIADKAAQFVDFSDMYNVRICLNESCKADIELNVLNDGSYEQSN